jgi:dTDP-4-amino-4,6-dideoxygalactose transaminase
MIPVTKPFLPPIEEYTAYTKGIWERNWLTNNGPLVKELELRLKQYLDLEHLLFLANGTIALQIAIKALELKGEIITTPFSYIATTSSIIWEGCTPIFADITPDTLNINPAKIEEAITSETSAILATHVYGNPCDIDAIQKIANKCELKVIYDAAHCFGTLYKGKSVFAYGDVSVTSFHATKLFHTIEGGAVFTQHPSLLKRMAFMRNFGHNGPEDFAEVGINGKNSEFHAAMGLVNLNYIGEILNRRKILSEYYNQCLKGLEIRQPLTEKNATFNYSYYPLIFNSEQQAVEKFCALHAEGISPRRYFYPALNSLRFVKHGTTPVADDISRRVLCLPLYHEMTEDDVKLISKVLLK